MDWDRWRIKFAHAGHGVGESQHPLMFFGPFTSHRDAQEMANYLVYAGKVPATRVVSVELAPRVYKNHQIMPSQNGVIILPYNIETPSLQAAHNWIDEHVARESQRGARRG